MFKDALTTKGHYRLNAAEKSLDVEEAVPDSGAGDCKGHVVYDW